MHSSVIRIDSQQFIANLCLIREHLNWQSSPGKIQICLPVKANAYGHGLVGVSALAQPYVDYFGVSCVDEGKLLRLSGIYKPILVFGAFNENQVAELIENNLEITISSLYKLKIVAEFCRINKKSCRVHLKIDTGMNRIGVRVESAYKLIEYALQHPLLELVGMYSHLASSEGSADQFTYHQISVFNELRQYVTFLKKDVLCHLANSGGVCYYKDSWGDMVRPGILAYGYFPGETITSGFLNQIKPCFSLHSKVSYFKVVAADCGISYNHLYNTSCQTRVVTVPIGYGDGYKRCLSNIGEIIIRGKKHTVSGIICMDMLMVDIGVNGEAYVNDDVVLIGKQLDQEITLDSIALKCGTITYEILCGFNERIPRSYV